MNHNIITLIQELSVILPNEHIECRHLVLPSLRAIWLRKGWVPRPLNQNPPDHAFNLAVRHGNNIDYSLLEPLLLHICMRIESYSKTLEDIERVCIRKGNEQLTMGVLMKGIKSNRFINK